MKPLPAAARVMFGLAVAGSGLMQVLNTGFVRLVSTLPAWLPWPRAWAVGGGLILLLIGAALAMGRKQRLAALSLVVLLGVVFIGRVPEIVANPGAGYVWTNPAKVLALLGTALLLAGEATRVRLLAVGLLATFLLICGAQHLAYADFVDTLVPGWIPPGPRFWTLFSGVALLAGGVGVLMPSTRRLAGLLTGVMIFLWVVLLHVPRSLELKNAFELAAVFEALALAAAAWLVSGAGRGGRAQTS
ncbi:MAG TPA: hypothetical protein VHN79_14260 [Lacunisphaera sp.]|nr:hypothetical protein [Lacunisphaera sp.]